MRIAALVKPIPDVRAAAANPERSWPPAADHLVVNPFDRRAVAQACELAAAVGDGTVTVVMLGPPSAEPLLRAVMAAATETDVVCDGLLLDDAATDSVDVARALAAALADAGGFDLVLTGRRGVDGGGGHVGAQVAARLDLPFVGAARFVSLQRSRLHVRCQLDDGWAQASVALPAVVSCAERLIDPSTAPPPARAVAQVHRVHRPRGAMHGTGARVDAVRRGPDRQRLVLDGSADAQVRRVVEVLAARGALADPSRDATVPSPAVGRRDAVVAVLDPARRDLAPDLLGATARVAEALSASVVALGAALDGDALGAAGADVVVRLDGSSAAEDVAAALTGWAAETGPRVVLLAATDWGREVAARATVGLDAALLAGATAVEVDAAHRLTADVPVLGGLLLATMTTDVRPAVVTIRPGALPRSQPRRATRPEQVVLNVPDGSRVRIWSRTLDAGLVALDRAAVVVGVGRDVEPADYPRLAPLLDRLDAAVACTRPVADRGWQPAGRQVGLTGRALTPRLYVTVGIRGACEHLVGVAGAGTILAVHPARDAPVFDAADVGIVAPWRDVVDPLVAALDPR